MNLNELILTDEEFHELKIGCSGMIELYEEDSLNAIIPLVDFNGNSRGSIELKLSEFKYNRDFGIIAKYEIMRFYND